MDLFDLTGKTAIVTGGNRGIGLGIATGLAKAGASVAIWSRNEAKNAEAAEIVGEYGKSLAVGCDISDPDSVEEAMSVTMSEFGRLDAFFANAGITGVEKFEEMSLEDWKRIIDVNLNGAFITIQAASREMIRGGEGGSIVATASLAATFAIPQSPHYTASKGGLVQLVRAAAVRLARYHIRVNVISPGWVATEMSEDVQGNEKANAFAMTRTPMRRWGQPEDFEGPAVFLASDASRFVTGAELQVDGGFRAA